MRVIVVGLGVQGYKRRKFAGGDFVASVDPVNYEADYRTLREVPLDSFDAALLCTPDEPKMEMLSYLLGSGKHSLVEKPLWAASEDEIDRLEAIAKNAGAYCYTAYNHRFEPHFMAMKELVDGGGLGEIYACRMFYGNGTARLVRDSAWRDNGAGVLPDLGSHLLDTLKFWFGKEFEDFDVIFADRFENRAPDRVVLASRRASPRLELEMMLLSWRNHFTCDIFAEKGSAHISSLCKWGPSSLTVRRRVLPSGRPPEKTVTLVQDDPTWEDEYRHFKNACKSGEITDLSNDKWLNRVIQKISRECTKEKIN